MRYLLSAAALSAATFAVACLYVQRPPVTAPAPTASAAAYCTPRAAALPPPAKLADWAAGAQLFDNLGSYHRQISTTSEAAQRYFDQGLRLIYGFNHDEAARAFVKAAQLDPACAACYWGAALTLGPNYNMIMLPDRAQAAWDALTQAQAQLSHATPVEQALIAALSRRYAGPEPLDPPAMQPHQQAYADAMRAAAQQFPDDLDVQTLYAESLMNLNPWKLWSLDGKPAPGTEEIVAVLESVLRKSPQHPGANHYYIHAVEASPHPEKAVASAERVGTMMKGAGHLVHMPAHIFQRVGRYADAEAANLGGAAADLAYMQRVAPQGYYPFYLAHNYDFLSYSESMQGRSRAAIEAARKTAGAVPREMLNAFPGMDFFVAKIYFAELRFGQWDAVLAEPTPDEKYPVLTGIHRYARAYALAAKGQVREAAKLKTELDLYTGRLPPDLMAGYSSAKDFLALASQVLAARIAQQEGKPEEAIQLLRAAAAREAQMPYDEPADWYFPVRHLLGAALLRQGAAGEAEAVYRADLRQYPANGWALYGLMQALKAQQRTEDAAQVEQQFKAAWARADVALSGSAL